MAKHLVVKNPGLAAREGGQIFCVWQPWPGADLAAPPKPKGALPEPGDSLADPAMQLPTHPTMNGRPVTNPRPTGGARFCPWIILSLFFWFTLSGQGASLPLEDTNIDTTLIPANTPLLTESMLWDEQLRVESGLGYKDNVLLSPFNRQGSAFFVNGLDALAMRLPLDGWQVTLYLTGDDIRYWHNVGTSSEDSFLGTLRIQRELPAGWKAGWEVRGLYEKQVLDISPYPNEPSTALVAGESLRASPSLRKDWDGGGWLQVEMPVTRWWLAAPLDDYWEFGPVVTAGFAWGPRTEFTASYGASYEDHNAWQALYNVDGSGVLPWKLEIFQDRVEFDWRQYWDAHRRWRSATEFSFADRMDNGGGYFNEYQYQAVQDLRWQTADWLVKGSVSVTCEDYLIQYIGRFNGETLNRNLWEVAAEVERHLWRGLRVYAKLNYQRAISNEDLDAGDYHATTATGGVRWEF